jgi:hypothetical protein
LIPSSPAHGDSDRDGNERTVAVDCGLQRSLCRNGDFATHPPEQLDAFGPPPFSATTEAQRNYHTHWVNLTDTFSGVDHCFYYIGSNFAFASVGELQSQLCITARSFLPLQPTPAEWSILLSKKLA